MNTHEEIDHNLEKVKKTWLKYLGSLKHSMASSSFSYMEKGESVILEIIPDYFSTLDYGKSK